MNYLTAHPQFDHIIDIELLTSLGFEDTSYCNDLCPSFTKSLTKAIRLTLWIDYKDIDLKDIEDYPMYSLTIEDNEANLAADYFKDLTNTNDWSKVIAYIKEHYND